MVPILWLCSILNRLKYELCIEIFVVHVNHGLREKMQMPMQSMGRCTQGHPIFLKEACVSELARHGTCQKKRQVDE